MAAACCVPRIGRHPILTCWVVSFSHALQARCSVYLCLFLLSPSRCLFPLSLSGRVILSARRLSFTRPSHLLQLHLTYAVKSRHTGNHSHVSVTEESIHLACGRDITDSDIDSVRTKSAHLLDARFDSESTRMSVSRRVDCGRIGIVWARRTCRYLTALTALTT